MIDFLRSFVWFPLDSGSTEHQLLQVNNWSLEEDDKEECESGGDGEDADELLCEKHAAEPNRMFCPAVYEVDDRPENDLVKTGPPLFFTQARMTQDTARAQPILPNPLKVTLPARGGLNSLKG